MEIGKVYLESSEDEEMFIGSWIQWFCSLEGNDFLVEVDEDYIRDAFNLYGLRPVFPNFKQALQTILSDDIPEEEDFQDQKYIEFYKECSDLYGLIHARYIQSPPGLSLVKEKYLVGEYGTCPRILCERQNLLPIGTSEELEVSRVKVFCPRCEELYFPKPKCGDIDGAYFGKSVAHLVLMNYPELIPSPSKNMYIPRIYGFKLYRGAK